MKTVVLAVPMVVGENILGVFLAVPCVVGENILDVRYSNAVCHVRQRRPYRRRRKQRGRSGGGRSPPRESRSTYVWIFGLSDFQTLRLSDFYGTLLDPTGPYWTLLDPTGPYWTLLDLTGPH